MKIRSPWGFTEEWNGDWSEESGRWTVELRELLSCRLGDTSGIKFMSFEDYLDQYKRTCVTVEKIINP